MKLLAYGHSVNSRLKRLEYNCGGLGSSFVKVEEPKLRYQFDSDVRSQNECCYKNRVQEVNWSRVVHAFLQCLGPWIDEHCLMRSLFLNQRIVSVTVKSKTCLYLEPCQTHDPSGWLLGKRGSWGCRISMSRETRVPFEKILPPTLTFNKGCVLKGAVSFGSILHRSCTQRWNFYADW